MHDYESIDKCDNMIVIDKSSSYISVVSDDIIIYHKATKILQSYAVSMQYHS